MYKEYPITFWNRIAGLYFWIIKKFKRMPDYLQAKDALDKSIPTVISSLETAFATDSPEAEDKFAGLITGLKKAAVTEGLDERYEFRCLTNKYFIEIRAALSGNGLYFTTYRQDVSIGGKITFELIFRLDFRVFIEGYGGGRHIIKAAFGSDTIELKEVGARYRTAFWAYMWAWDAAIIAEYEKRLENQDSK